MLGIVDGNYGGPVVDPTVAYETLLQLGMEPAHAATLLQRHTITVTAAAASPSSFSSPPSYTHSPSRVGGTDVAAAAASMLLEEGSPEIVVVAPSRLRYDYDDDVEKDEPSKHTSPPSAAGPNIAAYNSNNSNHSNNENEETAVLSPNTAGTRPAHLRHSAIASSSSSASDNSGVLHPHDAAADAAHCAKASHRTTSYSSASFSGSSSSPVRRHGSHGSAKGNVAAAAAAASPQSTSVHERVHEIVDALLSPYRRQRRDGGGSGAASTATMSSDSPRRSQRRFSPIARPSHSEQEEDEETAPNLPPLPLLADTYYDADHLHLWLAGNGRPSYRKQGASSLLCPRYQAHHHCHPHVHPHSPNDDKAMMLKRMHRIGATHGAIISRSATLCNGDPSLIRQLTAQRARASDAKRQEASSRSRSHVAGGAIAIGGGGGDRQLTLAQQQQQLLLLSRVSSLERRQRCDPVRRMHWYEDQWAAAPLRLDVESAAWGQRRQICRSAPRGAVPFSDLYDATGSGHRRAGEWALRVVREHRDP